MPANPPEISGSLFLFDVCHCFLNLLYNTARVGSGNYANGNVPQSTFQRKLPLPSQKYNASFAPSRRHCLNADALPRAAIIISFVFESFVRLITSINQPFLISRMLLFAFSVTNIVSK